MSTKPPIHLLRLNNWSIYEQLQLEEALLRTDERNWCLFNQGASPAVVMGISGKLEELIHKSNPLPVYRRFSGGGTVVIDHNTLFMTLICNHQHVKLPPFPNQVLCWTGNLYHSVLAQHGFSIKENDYVLGNRKFGGNAQYFCRNRWLHHSTLLWDYEKELMQHLKIPLKMPKYRNHRDHTEFLCSLKHHLSDSEILFEGILSSLSQHFDVKDITLDEALCCLKKAHRKSTKKIC